MPPTSSTTLEARKRWRTGNSPTLKGTTEPLSTCLQTRSVCQRHHSEQNRLGVGRSIWAFYVARCTKLNPGAQIVETNFSEVNPTRILNTGLFDFDEAEESAGWIEELNKEEHTPETEEYGIGSFVYRTKCPSTPNGSGIFSCQFPIQHHPKQGAVLDSHRDPTKPSFGGKREDRFERTARDCGGANCTKSSRTQFPSFVENTGRHRKGMGPPLRRSEN